ncbi:ParB/RepB/Spo0J family partition protein [Streptomyces sp. P9(2023)]|uniref:ParB/RepB/Spo0J family partition protein n=1 Tax=Streptomyces sp. P9(2023) TaxID=3064394 RepID=UPI0028F3E584|nr:ParB/RepB/Spo0J family partition protein [Streptomyces sp. P9(2023)]MDT9687552.1 ParB/RepB/Spo0J family partition protein [Streptomyces sp. P9(2023)]
MSDGLVGGTGVEEHRRRRTASVPINSLHISGSPRIAGENARYIRTLAGSDIPLPPIIVHRATMRVVDGVHRLRATLLRGEKSIEVRFLDGTAEDAFVLAVSLNTRHGMPLSQADRTAAAARILGSHPHWSDRRIAEVIGLSPTTVATLRSRSTGQGAQLNARAGRDGRVRPLAADAAERRRRAARFISVRPDASLREVAAVADVAVATARDVRERLRTGEDPLPPKLRAAERRTAPAECARPVARQAQTPPEEEGGAAVTGARVPGAGRRVVRLPQRFAHQAAPNLRKDPSLRFTEAGRTLLRLWSAHAMDADRWRWLADSVPPHRLADAVWAADQCAVQWRRFAEDLRLRVAENRDRAG